MSSTRNRTLSYVRAEFLSTAAGNKNSTLEDYLRQTFKDLPTVEDRTLELLGKTFAGVKYDDPRSTKPQERSFSFRLATSVVGRNASLLPHEKRNSNIDTPQTPPPAGNDFMDGDAHVHIHNNHVFYCSYHLRLESIQYFLRKIFKKANIDARSSSVELLHVASNDIAQKIIEEGIKSVGMNASMYKATSFDLNSIKKTERIFSGIAAPFSSFFEDGGSLSDSIRTAGLSTKVEFQVDKRQLKNSEYNPLEIITSDLISELEDENDLDSFYVTTLKGNIFRGSKFVIRSTASLPEDGQTVNCDAAWRALVQFKSDLVNNGKLTF